MAAAGPRSSSSPSWRSIRPPGTRSASPAAGEWARVPDATGLELIAQDLRSAHGDDAVLGTLFFREKPAVDVAPARVTGVLAFLRERGFGFLASVHGLDYYPEEPRLGVQYELLDMTTVDRITVRLRVPTDAPNVPSVTPECPTADHQEREVYDMFG